jgi:3-oxoacyl-[acyl-carrier-protein] synthase II
MGLVTPLGRGVVDNFRAVARGESGLRLEADDERPAWMRCVGRVVNAELPPGLPAALSSQVKYLNRGGTLGAIAAAEAAAQAGLEAAAAPPRRALYVATGDFTMVGCEFLYPATHAASAGLFETIDTECLNRATLDSVNPFFLLQSLNNNPFSFLAAAFECTGPGTTLASQSPGGCLALELAARTVREGRAEVALVVASGSWLNVVPLVELEELGLLSRATRGAASFRPFDRHRDGFLVGEGGAAVVVEPLGAAEDRGVAPLAVVEGTASHRAGALSLAPPPDVTRRSMELALAEAGRSARELGFVSPHGSGTRKGDRAEMQSLLGLLREAGAAVPICASKPATGHMGAASDLAEVILGVLAASSGSVPGTQGFEATEPEFSRLHIAGTTQPCVAPRFLSASYGLGGQSAAVVVSVPPAWGADQRGPR